MEENWSEDLNGDPCGEGGLFKPRGQAGVRVREGAGMGVGRGGGATTVATVAAGGGGGWRGFR